MEREGKIVIVEAIVADSAGRILLLRRSDKNRHYVDQWQLPGGKVNFGEDLKKAIKREVKEETGCVALRPRLERIFSVSRKETNYRGDVLLLVYSSQIKGCIELSCEHSEYEYFDMDEIDRKKLTKLSKTALFSK